METVKAKEKQTLQVVLHLQAHSNITKLPSCQIHTGAYRPNNQWHSASLSGLPHDLPRRKKWKPALARGLDNAKNQKTCACGSPIL